MRKTLVLAALPLLAGCEDFVSSAENPPFIHGSYDVTAAAEVSAANRLADGWTIGINFYQTLPARYMIVEVPPEGLFVGAIVRSGTFSTSGERSITFFESGFVVDRAEFDELEDRGLRLQLEGGLGYRELVTTPWSFSEYPYLSGTWEPLLFELTTEEGETVDLAAVEGADVRMFLDTYWGTHQIAIQAPAGVLAEGEVTELYTGRFNTVGASVVIHEAFGCEVFAGDATMFVQVEFRGFACDIGGEPYLLKARFRR